ncbi:hypothetical protein PQR39_35730 [Paraburkholderia sediminicola]|uniref:hypothetical protein n=1 Tax=Paraburkholderia sediminicola TaxID=458836 RepID=UPI0038BBB066
MRTEKDSDFNVEVEGFGTFIFGRRTKEDVYKIRSRYNVLTEGNYEDDGSVADFGALGLVTLQTLMVSAPETFNLDAMDPLMDDDFENKIMKVFGALRAKEQSFRQKPAKGSKEQGS